jgi:hypothetical protein
MTEKQFLKAIVTQGFENPDLVGRVVSRLRKNDAYAQKHRDKKTFDIFWRNTGDFWRCTLFMGPESDDVLAQIDLHTDGTTRVELYEPSSVTIDPSEDLLILSRFSPTR